MKYTKEKFDLIVAEYKSGKSLKEICTKYDVARSTVYSWLHKHKVLINSDKKKEVLVNDYFNLENKFSKLNIENYIY